VVFSIARKPARQLWNSNRDTEARLPIRISRQSRE
jgi:hypothetical protein